MLAWFCLKSSHFTWTVWFTEEPGVKNALQQTFQTRFGLKQIKFSSHLLSLSRSLCFFLIFRSPASVWLSVSREAFLLLAALYLALPFPMSLSLCVSLCFLMWAFHSAVSPFFLFAAVSQIQVTSLNVTIQLEFTSVTDVFNTWGGGAVLFW